MTHSDTNVATTAKPQTLMSSAPIPGRPQTSALPRLSSQHILGSAREVVIDHQGIEYRLRHTRAGKLILTK
jgi:hemin uptake protein HemP